MKNVDMVHEQRDVGAFGEADQFERILSACAERFLDDHMFAALQCVRGQLEMGADRRCDCDGVHSAAFNQLLSIVKREQSGVELVRLGQVIRPLVGYRCDRKSWVFLKAAKQIWTPVAKTDNS